MNREIMQDRVREEALYRRYQVVRGQEGASGFPHWLSQGAKDVLLSALHLIRSLFMLPQHRHHG